VLHDRFDTFPREFTAAEAARVEQILSRRAPAGGYAAPVPTVAVASKQRDGHDFLTFSRVSSEDEAPPDDEHAPEHEDENARRVREQYRLEILEVQEFIRRVAIHCHTVLSFRLPGGRFVASQRVRSGSLHDGAASSRQLAPSGGRPLR
jgi:hypothetical protein